MRLKIGENLGTASFNLKALNQSPSLNGFISANFVSMRKAQRKLRQVTS